MTRELIVSHLYGIDYFSKARSFLWLPIAACLGLLVATQSLTTLFILVTATLFLFCGILTPLAAAGILVLVAPLRTLMATEAALQLPLDIGQLALLGVLSSWSLFYVARGRRLNQEFSSPVTAIIITYILVTGITVFNATSLAAWLSDWLKWVQILFLVVFVINVGYAQRWQWLLIGLVASGVANAFVGLYEFFGGSGALHLLIGGKYFRAFGTFGQPNPFGGFMGILIPVTLMAGLAHLVRIWRVWRSLKGLFLREIITTIFYVVAGISMLVGIGISWSRGAWIGLGGAILVMVFAVPRKTIHGFFAIILLISIFTALWITGILPASVIERLSTSTQEFFAFEDMRGVDITSENYAVVERLAHWQAALNMISDHPLFGVGMGNYEIVYRQYRLINWLEPLGHAHNYYLNIFAEAGFIGLLGYLKVWVVIIVTSWQIRKHPDILSRSVGIGLLGSWTYISIHNFFDNLYVNNLFLHLGLMIGIVAVLARQVYPCQRSKLT